MKEGLVLIAFVIVGVSLFIYDGIRMDNYHKDTIRFESRCAAKGGLTLQAFKTGKEWIGCYKDNKELDNEE